MNKMGPVWTILVFLVMLSIVVWVVETLPLPPIPKRIGEAVLALATLGYLAHHLHWLAP